VTKQARDGWRLAGTLASIRCDKRSHDQSGYAKHCDERRDDRLAAQWLSISKQYLEGRLAVTFELIGVSRFAVCTRTALGISNDVKANVHSELCANPDWDVHSRKEWGEVNSTHLSNGNHNNDKLMLIGYVQGVNGVQDAIPTRVRFQRLNCIDDLFAGDLHLSALKGGFKTLLPFGKGKLDRVGVARLVSDHPENREVESGTHVVNGVSNDERGRSWDGLILFDEVGLVAGLGLYGGHQADGLPVEIGFQYPVEIADVMFRPFDFEERGDE
jgi:hypothetical protein